MQSILYLSCVSLACGGAERVLSILSSSFVEHFDKVKIFLWIDCPVFYNIDSRIEIINIAKEANSSNYIKKIIWFRNYLRNNKSSIILSFLAKSSIPVLLATIGLDIPVIVGERNDPRHLRGGWIMIKIRDFIYNRATRILEQTENNKNYFTGTKLNKTDVIYNPVFMNPDDVGIALSTPKSKKIVSVGRLNPQKNQKLLIEAMFVVHRSYPQYQLIIYGDGEERESLEKLISQLDANAYIILYGNSKNIFNEIKDAEVFALSSDFEGMPNALLEAMCLGLPCVSTRVSGATELIKDGENGLLVDIANKQQLADAMCRLLADVEYRNSIGISASNIYNVLSYERISNQWIDYLHKYMKYE